MNWWVIALIAAGGLLALFGIVWTDKKRDIRDFVKNLPQLIYRLMHCADAELGV